MTQGNEFEKAKELYKTANADQRYVLEKLFPNLVESEDERIREVLITFFQRYPYGSIGEAGANVDEVLAWLEKQSEQKPAEWHREDEQNLNVCLGYIPDEFLRRWLTDIIHVKYDKLAWSEEDERIYKSVLYAFEHNYPLIKEQQKFIKSLKEKVQPKQEWSEEDEKLLNEVIELIDAGALDRKEKDNYINRLKSLEERMKGE